MHKMKMVIIIITRRFSLSCIGNRYFPGSENLDALNERISELEKNVPEK